ncbi:MAG: methyltransferase [Nitrospinae bacterium]|nr:methyltransferase [Nitrospinota bacterium]
MPDIRQTQSGYRYSLDPFLLSDFVPPGAYSRVADLGTGNGILPRLLAKKIPAAAFMGFDIQHEPLTHAVENCAGLGRALFVRADICEAASLVRPGSFDLAVSNPPYRKAGAGRLNPSSAKAVARHELALTLEQLVSAAFHLLKERGVFCVVHLAERSAELLHLLAQNGFAPQSVRFVYSREGGNAFVVLVSAVKGGKNPVNVLPPMLVYGADGEYSPEMRRIYGAFDA